MNDRTLLIVVVLIVVCSNIAIARIQEKTMDNFRDIVSDLIDHQRKMSEDTQNTYLDSVKILADKNNQMSQYIMGILGNKIVEDNK